MVGRTVPYDQKVHTADNPNYFLQSWDMTQFERMLEGLKAKFEDNTRTNQQLTDTIRKLYTRKGTGKNGQDYSIQNLINEILGKIKSMNSEQRVDPSKYYGKRELKDQIRNLEGKLDIALRKNYRGQSFKTDPVRNTAEFQSVMDDIGKDFITAMMDVVTREYVMYSNVNKTLGNVTSKLTKSNASQIPGLPNEGLFGEAGKQLGEISNIISKLQGATNNISDILVQLVNQNKSQNTTVADEVKEVKEVAKSWIRVQDKGTEEIKKAVAPIAKFEPVKPTFVFTKRSERLDMQELGKEIAKTQEKTPKSSLMQELGGMLERHYRDLQMFNSQNTGRKQSDMQELGAELKRYNSALASSNEHLMERVGRTITSNAEPVQESNNDKSIDSIITAATQLNRLQKQVNSTILEESKKYNTMMSKYNDGLAAVQRYQKLSQTPKPTGTPIPYGKQVGRQYIPSVKKTYPPYKFTPPPAQSYVFGVNKNIVGKYVKALEDAIKKTSVYTTQFFSDMNVATKGIKTLNAPFAFGKDAITRGNAISKAGDSIKEMGRGQQYKAILDRYNGKNTGIGKLLGGPKGRYDLGKTLGSIGKLIGKAAGWIGLILAVLVRMIKASPILQAIGNLFDLAMTLFFMPFGNALGTVLLPFFENMIRFMVAWNQLFTDFSLETLGEFLVTWLEAALSNLSNLWQLLIGAANAIPNLVISLMLDGLTELFRSMGWDSMVELLEEFKAGIGNIWDGLIHIFDNPMGLINVLAEFGTNILGKIANFWSDLFERILSIPKAIWDWIMGGLADILGNMFGEDVKNTVLTIKNSVDSIFTSIVALPQRIFDLFAGIGNGVSETFSSEGQLGWINPVNWHLFADGGLVKGATLGIVGEAGPEAVVPLDRADIFGNTYYITISGDIYGVSDLESRIENVIQRTANKSYYR